MEASRRPQPVVGVRRGSGDPRLTLAICLLLLAAAAIVFGQSVRAGFVNFDDSSYVYRNTDVRKGLSWEGTLWAFQFHQSNWHPLTWFSHMADCQRYGLWAGGHHLTSLLLHAATVVLLFLLLQAMTAQRWPSAGVAALFAIHPLHVESVAWVAERKDVLSGLFFVLTLAAYLRYVRRPFSLARYLLVVLCFILGLLAKPMLVTLPFVLLLLDYWPLGRMGGETEKWRRGDQLDSLSPFLSFSLSPFLALLLEKVPLLVLSAASCVATFMAQAGAIKPLDRFPWSSRVDNALVSYCGYLLQFFWPSNLASLYPYTKNHALWAVAASSAALAAVTVVVAQRRRYPFLLVGWLWFLGMLVPVIGLVQVGDQASADRYMYLPLIGLAMALAWGVKELAGESLVRRRLCGIGSLVVLASLTIAAWKQASYWHDSETLWTRTLTCTRGNWLAHHNLGSLYLRTQREDEAIVEFRKALEIRSDLARSHDSLAKVLAERGDYVGAAVHFRAMVAIDPHNADVCNNLGYALYKAGQPEEAVLWLEKAVALKPDFARAVQNLALAGQAIIRRNDHPAPRAPLPPTHSE